MRERKFLRVAAVSLCSLGLLQAGAGSARQDERRFAQEWRDKVVYLLLPPSEGRKRGLLRTTHFDFHYGVPDGYRRGVSIENGIVGFDTYRIKGFAWDKALLRMTLQRVFHDELQETPFRPKVALNIHYGSEQRFDPDRTHEILSSVIIEEESFPGRLGIGGTGPPDFGEPTVAVRSPDWRGSIRISQALSELRSWLGSPLESFQVLRNARTFEYLWYEDYRILIVACDGRVIRVHSIFM